MKFLADIFVKYWEEVIVAVMLVITLPFVRKYVRRQRAKVLGFFKENERLKESLREAEGRIESLTAELERERKAREDSERKSQLESEKMHKAQSETDSMRVIFHQERAVREVLERKLKTEAENTHKAQSEADTLRAELQQEREARDELERKLKAEADKTRKAQSEADTLRAELQQELKARDELERKYQADIEEKQKAQEVEKNSIEAEFNRKYEKTQNEIKEKGGFIKFAEEILEDSKALRYDKTTYEYYCKSWTLGLLMPTHLLFTSGGNDVRGIDRLMWSVPYLLASQHSKDEISQFSENALISFYDFAKEALLAVGVHLVNCGKMTLDELRNGYCGNILDFREMIRNRTQDSRATYSSNRSAYNRTTEILRKAIEAKKGNNNS